MEMLLFAGALLASFVIGFVLFVFAAYGIARLLFPRIEIDDSKEQAMIRQFPDAREHRLRMKRRTRQTDVYRIKIAQ